MCHDLTAKLNDSDMVLIGLGEEFAFKIEDDEMLNLINKMAVRLEHCNYFIVATFNCDILRKSQLNQKRIVYPYKANNNEYEAKQWDLYNKWLSTTLAKKLLIIEAGEGFTNPNIIRWPFERITMINNSAFLIRIHPELFQIPVEIQNKAMAIDNSSFKYIKDWLKDC